MRKERDIHNLVIISIVCVSILIISLVAVLIVKSSKKSNDEQFAGEMSNYEEVVDDYESASTQMGKSVDESEEEYEIAEQLDNGNTVTNQTNTASTNSIKNDNNIVENKTTSTTINEIGEAVIDENETENTISSEVENSTEIADGEENSESEDTSNITFQAPIKGEILREFAKDSLVYSSTLQEWITHNGIDIKADKTSVVSAAASGTVYAIKNDPRYGLTVIINHDNGYQTVYSNLLTAEFVVKGEEVEQGQSIGTVGNSASFEISDDYHLHFELLRNNEYLDPVIYMDFE